MIFEVLRSTDGDFTINLEGINEYNEVTLVFTQETLQTEDKSNCEIYEEVITLSSSVSGYEIYGHLVSVSGN